MRVRPAIVRVRPRSATIPTLCPPHLANGLDRHLAHLGHGETERRTARRNPASLVLLTRRVLRGSATVEPAARAPACTARPTVEAPPSNSNVASNATERARYVLSRNYRSIPRQHVPTHQSQSLLELVGGHMHPHIRVRNRINQLTALPRGVPQNPIDFSIRGWTSLQAASRVGTGLIGASPSRPEVLAPIDRCHYPTSDAVSRFVCLMLERTNCTARVVNQRENILIVGQVG